MADKHLDGLVNLPNAAERYGRAWRGRITRISGTSAWVVITGIAPGYELGPCDLRGITAAVGDSVLVTFVGGDNRDPIILRLLQSDLAASHPDFSLLDGSRAYTGPVAGVTPVAGADLTTKDFVEAHYAVDDHVQYFNATRHDAHDHTAVLGDYLPLAGGTMTGELETAAGTNETALGLRLGATNAGFFMTYPFGLDQMNVVVQGLTVLSFRDLNMLINRETDMTNHKVINVTDPTNAQDAATKVYVDGRSPTGSIIMYSAATAPTGWLECNGDAVSRTTYADLFALIGTTYGVGDGSTTFNVPDLSTRFPVGFVSDGSVQDYALADTGGANTVALAEQEMPLHNHTVNPPSTVTNTDTHSHSLNDITKTQATGGGSWNTGGSVAQGGDSGRDVRAVGGSTNSDGHTHSVDIAAFFSADSGGTAAHENRPPYLAVNFIIKT